MEDSFNFDLGIGRLPWSSADVIIEVTIPSCLHRRVADCIGTGKMVRLEFGFHFQQIVEEKFPELEAAIRESISAWTAEHSIDNREANTQFYYSLQSAWFD